MVQIKLHIGNRYFLEIRSPIKSTRSPPLTSFHQINGWCLFLINQLAWHFLIVDLDPLDLTAVRYFGWDTSTENNHLIKRFSLSTLVLRVKWLVGLGDYPSIQFTAFDPPEIPLPVARPLLRSNGHDCSRSNSYNGIARLQIASLMARLLPLQSCDAIEIHRPNKVKSLRL